MVSKSTFLYPFPNFLWAEIKPIRTFIERYWFLNRTPVSPDMDKLARGLVRTMRPYSKLIESKSGEECLSWIMPKKWTVNKGVLSRVTGEILADFNANPLHLWSHSIGYKGRVSRNELLQHVVSDPRRPDDFYYHYRNSFDFKAQDWGFSLPHRLVQTLKDPFYDVDIDAKLDTSGSLKVIEGCLPGRNKETVCIMAHTCHPAQIGDGISSIAVALQLFDFLRKSPSRKYTYRFIFGPEYFSAASYLEKATSASLKNIKYAMFLDMLSSHEPIGFQRSLDGNSLLDHVTANVIKTHCPFYVERLFRMLWGNDEAFYNSPGFDVPNIGIGRTMNREYHYNVDDLQNCSDYHIVESLWVLRRIIEVLESDYVPIPQFRGPLYLSRYDLYKDFNMENSDYLMLQNVQLRLDGRRSVWEIAHSINADYFRVKAFIDELAVKKLVAARPHK